MKSAMTTNGMKAESADFDPIYSLRILYDKVFAYNNKITANLEFFNENVIEIVQIKIKLKVLILTTFIVDF